MFVNYTSDLKRTVSVLRDFCKKLHFRKYNEEKKMMEIDRNYVEVGIDSYHLQRVVGEDDSEHTQGYFAIDEKSKKVVVRVTDDYFLRLTFEMKDMERVEYPEECETVLQKVKPAHEVVTKKLAHYELRGFNGDEDLIDRYYPCRCVEQSQYKVDQNTYTFSELPWNLQISSITKDILKASEMRLKDWERKDEKDDYNRKYL